MFIQGHDCTLQGLFFTSYGHEVTTTGVFGFILSLSGACRLTTVINWVIFIALTLAQLK